MLNMNRTGNMFPMKLKINFTGLLQFVRMVREDGGNPGGRPQTVSAGSAGEAGMI